MDVSKVSSRSKEIAPPKKEAKPAEEVKNLRAEPESEEKNEKSKVEGKGEKVDYEA